MQPVVGIASNRGSILGQEEVDPVGMAAPEQADATAAAEDEEPKKSGWARELVETLLLTAIIFFGVRAVVQSFRVDGLSMWPSLHTDQLLLVNKAVYWRAHDDSLLDSIAVGPETGTGEQYFFHAPTRGEVIVFEAPRDPGRDYIKRVIGMPGDVVEIKAGKVYLNGKPLQEPYIKNAITEANGFRQDNRWKVPPGNLYVLGDNRPGSSDSRDWGFVPIDNVVGKAIFAYWPISDWGGIPHAAVILWRPWLARLGTVGA